MSHSRLSAILTYGTHSIGRRKEINVLLMADGSKLASAAYWAYMEFSNGSGLPIMRSDFTDLPLPPHGSNEVVEVELVVKATKWVNADANACVTASAPDGVKLAMMVIARVHRNRPILESDIVSQARKVLEKAGVKE